MSTEPQRIAILGGGVGAMTAAYWLTTLPDWQQRYRIDVYQMGWRLGGKGASGRNASQAARIQEHGLHIWFGFYDNAFATMQRVYAELGRPRGSALATWDEAFRPHDYVCLSEYIERAWRVWPVIMPRHPGTPGTVREERRIENALHALSEQLEAWLYALDTHWKAHHGQQLAASTGTRSKHAAELAPLAASRAANHAAQELARNGDAQSHAGELARLLRHLQELLHGALCWLPDPAAWPDELRRLCICVDLALAAAIGMLADGVLTHGFEAINAVEFRDWLAHHGALPMSIDSAPVRGFYDLVFAYRDGDPARPEIEAGTMLRGMLKVGFGYRGSIMYKMQAGMGDVVFAPVYELLRRRGVNFHFFHKVLALEPDAAGDRLTRIELQQQVALRGQEYQPLVEVKGLPCWPAAPLSDQIEPAQAELLARHDIDLESHWSPWPQVYREAFGRELPRQVLQDGKDFDQVIFGLSVASLAEVAPGLLAYSSALAACSAQIKTVATQAYQIWLHQDLAGMGWEHPGADGQRPVLSGFTEPFDTWASMDQLPGRESWPVESKPCNISYFCNAFPQAAYPPAEDHGFPQRCAARVKQAATAQLAQNIDALWTAAGDGFPWRWLVDPEGRDGAARFNAQYWRVNVDPSERYVMSATDTSRFRLRTGDSGFANLLLAGDWLKTGLDAGCVEAAVMSGMQVSRALCGAPRSIAGEDGW